MEKIVEEVIKSKRITHRFYCDDCSQYLGESTEYDDGWYPAPEGVHMDCLELNVCRQHYTLNKCLCERCYGILKDKIDKALLELGFERN